jgi:hypothetical protein
MKAYVERNRNGSVVKGWLLRQGTSIGSSMCRLSGRPAQDSIEEVPVEVAVRGAGQVGVALGGETEGGSAAQPGPEAPAV